MILIIDISYLDIEERDLENLSGVGVRAGATKSMEICEPNLCFTSSSFHGATLSGTTNDAC
jgi:hypothetical protein